MTIANASRNIQAALRDLANSNVLPVVNAGVPTSGTSGTGAGLCGKGTVLIDVTNGGVYINTNTKASPTWTVVSNVTSTAVNGLQTFGIARAQFDPSLTAGDRTVAAHTLGVTIPNKAIVCGGVVQVNTAFDSADDTSTVALSIQSANDLVTAAAVSGAPYSTTGLKAITPKINTPESTGIALTADRLIIATVAVQALTAGKLTVNLVYLMGA